MENGKTWSSQQIEIFRWFEKSQGNLIVRARAGTGKTTTIIEAIKYAPNDKTLLVAFNKSIATELQKKLNSPNAEAKTLHALGFQYIRNNWKNVKVDGNRGFFLAEQICGKEAPKDIITKTAKLAGLVKNACPDMDFECVMDLAISHDCLPDDENWTVEDLVESAISCVKAATENTGTIDFDDMIFLPVYHGWVRAFWSLVVVDEAQDMNSTQLLLAQKACKKNGRVVIVGDDRQAIYGFRGADSNAIDRLKDSLQAFELNLTVTYRCPSEIVEYAKKLVPDYCAAPNAKAGEILEIQYSKLAESVKPGDFVLSRKNAPLAAACLSILRTGKPAKISGRDVAKSLLTLINKWKDRGVVNFLEKLGNWEEQELRKAEKFPEKRRENRERLVRDQADTLRTLSDGCVELTELRQRVEGMFVDETLNPMGVVLCSSIHKAKGQERERVFLFGETLYPGARKSVVEEQNLEYVAVTRAKNTLIWVNGVTGQSEE